MNYYLYKYRKNKKNYLTKYPYTLIFSHTYK